MENDSYMHVDHHVEVFSPDGSTLYDGNDGGIFVTSTPAMANTAWTNLNTTLNTVMFYPGISINPITPTIAFGGTQDNGTLGYQGNLEWTTLACGDGGFTAIDFVQPQNVYFACGGGVVGIVASANGGTTFRSAANGINTSDPLDFIPPMVMDPSNSSSLYFGTNHLYQTLNQALSWTAISPDLTNGSGGGITAIAVAPTDSNTVYTGAYGGVIYVTRNALSGATWTKSTPIPGGTVRDGHEDHRRPPKPADRLGRHYLQLRPARPAVSHGRWRDDVD